MRARCRVCLRSYTLTSRGRVWHHIARDRSGRPLADEWRPTYRCPGAGAPPAGSPGPELAPLLGQSIDRSDLVRTHYDGTVYLLHFDEPFGHAKHYTGWASDLHGRLSHHGTTSGANLLLHVAKAGIGWSLARTWSGDRNLERRLKRRGGASRLCPVCRPELVERLLTDHPSG